MLLFLEASSRFLVVVWESRAPSTLCLSSKMKYTVSIISRNYMGSRMHTRLATLSLHEDSILEETDLLDDGKNF